MKICANQKNEKTFDEIIKGYLFVDELYETTSAKIHCSSPSGVLTRAATCVKKNLFGIQTN